MAAVLEAICPKCHKRLRADRDIAGLTVNCPACKEKFAVPANEVPSIDTTASQARHVDDRERMTFGELRQSAGGILAGLAALTFLVTVRTHELPQLHYLSLMVAVGMATLFVIRRIKPDLKWQRAISFAVAIAAAMLWGRFDYSIHTWKSSEPSPYKEIEFTDYAKRSDYRPFWRHARFTTKDGDWITQEGPMTETGKLHGQWTVIDISGPVEEWTRHEWYWYGEQITEGEWHLRNK